ncbi:MAG: hypothetical protein ACHQD9_07355 [Chitinophagales bacterium]
MKRTLLYLLVLIALAAAAYFLVIKNPWGTLNVNETAFAIADTASIGKIFIADMQGKKILLERQKDVWMVDQKYPVRGDYIERLLSTIKNVTVSYPVSATAQNAVVKEMASHNKKVEIYDRSGKMIKSYYVGQPSLDELGTYMLMDGAEKPYVTDIPGFQGTLETRYTTDESAIRSGKIYDFRINEMKSVSVDYPSKPDSSFTIEILGPDSFSLKNKKGEAISKFNKQRVEDYLGFYHFVNCEAFVNDLPKKDTILQTDPFVSITVTDYINQPHATTCYYMPRNPASLMQYDREGNPLPFDSDHYFATINNGNDFVIIQKFHFGRLFKNLSWFLTNPKATHR